MQKKFGFVYIWRDRYRKMYYIGSHWGHFGDRYVCSSPWMKNAYSRRPGDFKRRILAVVETCVADLHAEEQHWLSMIADHELHDKYYNYKKVARGFDPNNPIPSSDRAKQAKTLKARWNESAFAKKMVSILNSPEAIEKRRIKLIGKKASQETREKQRLAKLGKPRGPHSDLHKQRISEAQKGRPSPLRGRSLSEGQKQQMRECAKERWANPEFKAKMLPKLAFVRELRILGQPVSQIFLETRKRGAEHRRSKLTEEHVRQIRASTESGRKLSKRYSVSKTTIYNVRNRKVWAHVELNHSVA